MFLTLYFEKVLEPEHKFRIMVKIPHLPRKTQGKWVDPARRQPGLAFPVGKTRATRKIPETLQMSGKPGKMPENPGVKQFPENCNTSNVKLHTQGKFINVIMLHNK